MSTVIQTFPNLKIASLLLLLAFANFGCGGAIPAQGLLNPSSTACQPLVAQILIGDNFLKPTCGCIGAGESGKIYPAPGNAICHLATSTTRVFFSLWGTQFPHQIVSIGGTGFLSSPIMSANQPPLLSSFQISFPSRGEIYEFKEIYTGMVGQFIVP